MGMGMGQAATRFKADHTVVSGDTLTLIALKYYGPGAHDKWRVIYDSNKGVIGDNPYLLKPGMVLRIPEV
jgi:nucleoid-associated protein YgaU